MKKVGLVILIFLILLLVLGSLVVVISQRTTFFGRAYTPFSKEEFSLENSYLFASPLSAKANGREKIRLTIFLLDSSGRGVGGQTVFLGEDERLRIYPVQAITDEMGRAIFDVSANTPGEYLMEARVGEKVIPKRVKLVFF